MLHDKSCGCHGVVTIFVKDILVLGLRVSHMLVVVDLTVANGAMARNANVIPNSIP